ncbi:MAG: DUF2695 domain-containing protein [Actinomycetes bacterium]
MQLAEVVSIDRRAVRRGECLYCYLSRVTETYGCDDTLKLTQRWIDAQPRSARWVVKWAEGQGGGCDCEVLFNVLRDDKRSARHRKVRCAASYERAANEIGRCLGAQV